MIEGPERLSPVTAPVPGPSSRSTERRRRPSPCGMRKTQSTLISLEARSVSEDRAARLPPTLPKSETGVSRHSEGLVLGGAVGATSGSEHPLASRAIATTIAARIIISSYSVDGSAVRAIRAPHAHTWPGISLVVAHRAPHSERRAAYAVFIQRLPAMERHGQRWGRPPATLAPRVVSRVLSSTLRTPARGTLSGALDAQK